MLQVDLIELKEGFLQRIERKMYEWNGNYLEEKLHPFNVN